MGKTNTTSAFIGANHVFVGVDKVNISNGTVTTFINGVGLASGLSDGYIQFDSYGNFYILNLNNNLLIFDTNGNFSSLLPNFGCKNILFYKDFFYFSGGPSIYKYDMSFNLITDNYALGGSIRFFYAVGGGMAFDAKGNFYVANEKNGGGSGNVTINILAPIIPITCFKEDTKILTNKGYVPIQKLRKGNLIKTFLDGYKAIDMIGKREIYHSASQERIKEQLYKCSEDNYDEIIEPLILTGCHSILVDDYTSEEQRNKTIEINGNTYVTDRKYRLPACADLRASVYETPGTYNIYHLALENDDYYMNYGIYANGLLVETCSKRYLKELSNMCLIE